MSRAFVIVIYFKLYYSRSVNLSLFSFISFYLLYIYIMDLRKHKTLTSFFSQQPMTYNKLLSYIDVYNTILCVKYTITN